MSRYRRANNPGASYFFTAVTYRRHPILCEADMRGALRDAIETVRANRPFEIEAWVLLPDHIHCIWTLPPGDADYATRWGMIKRHVDYVHYNPVKHGLCERVAAWPYPTFHRYASRRVYAPDWAGGEDIAEGAAFGEC